MPSSLSYCTFVDNLLVWSRAKLKRAVYVADLIQGVPVPISSITDNNGGNTDVDICYAMKEIFEKVLSGFTTEAGPNRDLLRKNKTRTFSVPAIRLAPLFILLFVFLLDFGTGDDKNCKHLKVRFDDTLNDHGALSGSSKCIHVCEENKRRNGDILSFLVEYLQSARLQQSYYCGCTSSTESLCISSFNRVPLKAPNVVVWNTSNPTNRTQSERNHLGREMLRNVQTNSRFLEPFRGEIFLNASKRACGNFS